MIVNSWKARPPLADHVETLWSFDAEILPTDWERRLPTGAMELVIDLCDDPLKIRDRDRPGAFQQIRGGLVCGAQSASVISNASRSAIGVHFRPGGAFPFFGMPLSELRDVHVPLEHVWGAFARELRERLREAATPVARLRIFERALVERLSKARSSHPVVRPAVERIVASAGQERIAGLARDSGFSQRRFIQLFRESVGLTPKAFARIQRFQHALRALRSGRTIDWARIALSCGYSDQAHLIHEFQSLCGLTPGALVTRRGVQTSGSPGP